MAYRKYRKNSVEHRKNASKERILSEFYINSFLTMHGIIPEFQQKRFMKLRVCPCEHAEATTEHIDMSCTLWNSIRSILCSQLE